MSTRFSGIRSLVFRSGSESASVQLGGGNPNGLITAESGSLFIDGENASLYINKDGSVEWRRIVTDPGSDPLTFSGPVIFEGGLSGSLTHLADGSSYINAGTDITVVTGADGSITISSTATDTTYTAGNGLDLVGTEFSVDDSVVATLSGSTFSGPVVFDAGLSGSLTKLADGSDYLIGGANVTLTTGSNGSITFDVPDGVEYTAGNGLELDLNEFNIDDSVVATLSGSTFSGAVVFEAGLSGSLTKLDDGSDYLVAGDNIVLTTGSNGSITIEAIGDGVGVNATIPVHEDNIVLWDDDNGDNIKTSGLTHVVAGEVIGLQLSGSDDDLSLALVPKGEGGIQASLSGDSRGIHAVDLQLDSSDPSYVAVGEWSALVAGKDNIASGSFSSIVGGEDSVAEGSHSAVIAGKDSKADGNNSVAIGEGAEAKFDGEVAIGAAGASIAGRHQSSQIVMHHATSDNALSEVLLPDTAQLMLDENSAYKFSFDIIGKLEGSTESVWLQVQGGVVRAGAANTATLIGQPAELRSSTSGAESWGAVIDTDTATGSLRIQVQGEESMGDAVIWTVMGSLTKVVAA